MKRILLKWADIVSLCFFCLIAGLYLFSDALKTHLGFEILEVSDSFSSTGLLFSIAFHFIMSTIRSEDLQKEYANINELIQQSTEEIVSSLNGVNITFFEDINDVDEYIVQKISQAKSCVYDFNWQDYSPINPHYRNQPKREYVAQQIDKEIKKFCSKKTKRGHKKLYKEIFTFSYPTNIGKMKDHIQYGEIYQCAFYENLDSNDRFPKLQYVVIDEKEVIFVSSSYIPNLCAIRNDRIAKIFSLYFEQAWELSKKIKNQKEIDYDVIKQIERNYN